MHSASTYTYTILFRNVHDLLPGTSPPIIFTFLVSPPATAMAKAKINHLPHHFVAVPLAVMLGGPDGRAGRDLTSRETLLRDWFWHKECENIWSTKEWEGKAKEEERNARYKAGSGNQESCQSCRTF